MKPTVQHIYNACGLDSSNIDSEAIDVFVEIIRASNTVFAPREQEQEESLQQYQEEMQSEYEDVIIALNELDEKMVVSEDDFYFEFDEKEYRIISDSSIWDIYVETIKDIVNDCCDLKLDNIPDFVAWEIDWEQTAKNAYADGYGHTFSGYDGSELQTKNYYIFRTN